MTSGDYGNGKGNRAIERMRCFTLRILLNSLTKRKAENETQVHTPAILSRHGIWSQDGLSLCAYLHVLSGSQYVGGVNTAAEMFLLLHGPQCLRKKLYGLYFLVGLGISHTPSGTPFAISSLMLPIPVCCTLG